MRGPLLRPFVTQTEVEIVVPEIGSGPQDQSNLQTSGDFTTDSPTQNATHLDRE